MHVRVDYLGAEYSVLVAGVVTKGMTYVLMHVQYQ